MSYFDPSTWRAASPSEVLANLSSSQANDGGRHARVGKKIKRKKGKPVGGILVFRSMLSPVDTYSYLKARFGEPNGLQSMMIHKVKMVSDDSANLFHWDYALKAGAADLTFTGAAREVHVWADTKFRDEDWLRFAQCLKDDFKNYGKQKSDIIKGWQKWYVFPNRFKSIADRCAELQENLDSALSEIRAGLPERPREGKRKFQDWGKRRAELTSKFVDASVQLSVLTPVMFESFLGLIVAILMKPEVRANKRLAENFRRSPLDVKIYELSAKCGGFSRAILDTNSVMRKYWTVVNERNDIIHGNVEPVKDALEVVYFEGNKPLFRSGGDAIHEYFESLTAQYRPDEVLKNYHLAHELIIEILDHMEPRTRESIIIIMDDTQPGWDNDRQKSGHLFPDYVASFEFEGLRYDTDLQPSNGAS